MAQATTLVISDDDIEFQGYRKIGTDVPHKKELDRDGVTYMGFQVNPGVKRTRSPGSNAGKHLRPQSHDLVDHW